MFFYIHSLHFPIFGFSLLLLLLSEIGIEQEEPEFGTFHLTFSFSIARSVHMIGFDSVFLHIVRFKFALSFDVLFSTLVVVVVSNNEKRLFGLFYVKDK